MPLAIRYLRCDVVRGSAKGGGGGSATDAFFTHAEIRDFTMTFGIQ